MEVLKCMPEKVGVEIAKYKLKSPDLEAEMLEKAERLEIEFLLKQPGYLGAMILKDTDGVYTDIVFAKTAADSKAICDAWMENDFCKSYLEMIDESSVEMRFLERLM